MSNCSRYILLASFLAVCTVSDSQSVDACPRYRKLTWRIHLDRRTAEVVAREPESIPVCVRPAHFDEGNVLLELEDPKSNKILFRKSVFVPLETHFDYFTDSPPSKKTLHGGWTPAQEALVPTYILWPESSAEQGLKVRFLRKTDGVLLAEGTQ